MGVILTASSNGLRQPYKIRNFALQKNPQVFFRSAAMDFGIELFKNTLKF